MRGLTLHFVLAAQVCDSHRSGAFAAIHYPLSSAETDVSAVRTYQAALTLSANGDTR